jgi:nitrilase
MRVAAIQLRTGDDPEANVARAFSFVDHAGADLVVLPEVFAHVTRHDASIEGRMRAKAKERGVWLCGSYLDGHNVALLVAPDGEVRARYRKIHLFPGESAYMKPGSEPVTAEIGGLRVGFAICYDLRFPELFRAQRADLYLAPSAFYEKNGRDHWEILVRARAIENLAYVVAPNQEGDLPNGLRGWGHSLIVDPWGAVLAEARGEGAIVAEVDPARLAEARRRLPVLDDRRL